TAPSDLGRCLFETSIIEAVAACLRAGNQLYSNLAILRPGRHRDRGRQRRNARAWLGGQPPPDDSLIFLGQQRAREEQKPAARSEQAESRQKNLLLKGYKSRYVSGSAQQLDIRVPADDTRGRARSVDQDPFERASVPETTGLTNVGNLHASF